MVKVTEVEPDAAVPVLRTYLSQVPINQPYFDVAPDSPEEASPKRPPAIRSFESRPPRTQAPGEPGPEHCPVDAP